MLRLITVLLTLLIPGTVFAQQSRTPVSVSRSGQDVVGAVFENALQQELSRSTQYVPRFSKEAKGKFEFHIDLSTVDVADKKWDQGKRSVVSVVIEQSGLPNSYPVATMWYHKVLVVDKDSVNGIAKELLDDIDARWCSYLKNSVGGCPKEKFYPLIY